VSLDFNTALSQAQTIAEPELRRTVDQLKTQFMTAFGELKETIHKDKIEKIFKEAAETKLQAFMAKTPEEQRKFARVYELKVMTIETYVLSAKIVADAKAASLFKEMLKQVLDTFGVVALNVLKTVATALISGALTGLTGGAGGPLAAMAVGAAGALLQPKPTT
jgi:hypothetical protein